MRSCGILLNVEWQFLTNVSGQPTAQEILPGFFTLEDGQIGCPKCG